jgi:hypothetical protein
MNSDHFSVPGFLLFLLNGSFGPSRIERSDIYIEQEGGVAAVGAIYRHSFPRQPASLNT